MSKNPNTEVIIISERTELFTIARALEDLFEPDTAPGDLTRNDAVPPYPWKLVNSVLGQIKYIDLPEYEEVDDLNHKEVDEADKEEAVGLFVETYTGEEAILIKQALHRRRAAFTPDTWEYAQMSAILGETVAVGLELTWEERFGSKNLALTTDTPGYHEPDANRTSGLLRLLPNTEAA